MIRLATLVFLMTSASATAGGPAWDEMVADPTPGIRAFGTIGACVTAVSDPQAVTDALENAGWERADEFDGVPGFQVDNVSVMFWEDGGFCMMQTDDFSTRDLTDMLAAFDIPPVGEDDMGCVQFNFSGTIATLTGGGNDPACTSDTEAALRFEVSQ